MRPRIQQTILVGERVNLSHLKAYKIKGRSPKNRYTRQMIRNYVQIKEMFRNISTDSELISRVEARLNSNFYINPPNLNSYSNSYPII